MATPITLCMIVRDEAAVIVRCLESVKPLLSHWLVVDTGSTDGTQELVRQTMGELPGSLLERPWKDFASNRNEAIAAARELAPESYLLVVDADDTIEAPRGFKIPRSADAYAILVRLGGFEYWRTHLFWASLDYHYEGPVHEVLVSAEARHEERLAEIVCVIGGGGARSRDPDKFRKDAGVLQAALEKEPDSARYAFYLAQSWRDAGEDVLARDAYRHAATLRGWDEQTWCAHLEVAKAIERIGRDPPSEIVHAYLSAYERRPSRAEPLCYLAMHLRLTDRIAAAYPFAKAAASIRRPEGDRLFVDAAVYAWRARDELAVSAYWVGRYDEALEANRKLLASKALPQAERARVSANFGFCVSKLEDR